MDWGGYLFISKQIHTKVHAHMQRPRDPYSRLRNTTHTFTVFYCTERRSQEFRALDRILIPDLIISDSSSVESKLLCNTE